MPEDIHWQKYAARFKVFPARLNSEGFNPDLIVCIPVFAEPRLLSTLESLWKCEFPGVNIEVIILFNGKERMTQDELALHEGSWLDCLNWITQHQGDSIHFIPIYIEAMPDPKGGVGWARKLVLDEAARRLRQDGILLCLDADCTVDENYLKEVYLFFIKNPDCDAASIYYEHKLEGIDPRTRHAITQYELHLRYLVHAQRWAGHPFAFQTVGSSMAIRRKGYLQLGGMNTRQAGEDFYFLQKFIEVGSLLEIKNTTVFPSSRISNRVPFGTGRAMIHLSDINVWLTSNPLVYQYIRPLFNGLEKLRQICSAGNIEDVYTSLTTEFELHPALMSYLRATDFAEECQKIFAHTATNAAFRKRFFRYFNAFKMIKYAHHMRDHFFSDVPVVEACRDLCERLGILELQDQSMEGYLSMFRSMDRKDK